MSCLFSVKKKLIREFPGVDEVVIEVALRTVSTVNRWIKKQFDTYSCYALLYDKHSRHNNYFSIGYINADKNKWLVHERITWVTSVWMFPCSFATKYVYHIWKFLTSIEAQVVENTNTLLDLQNSTSDTCIHYLYYQITNMPFMKTGLTVVPCSLWIQLLSLHS